MNTIFAVLAAILAAIAWILVKLKLYKKIEVKKLSFGKGKIVYTSFKGNYSNLMPTINNVKNDIESYCKQKNNSEFKGRFFGIYYDDPNLIADINECRAIIGFIFFDDEKSRNVDTEDFMVNFKSSMSYKTTNFDSFDAFGSEYPLFGSLSIFSAIYRAYPAIKEYGVKNGLLNKSLCSLEIYDYPSSKITICFPFSQSADSLLYLSGYPMPEYKAMQVNKKSE